MIIFIGVSGAGKGTQSDLLAHENGYSYISSGQIVRDHATAEQKQQMLAGHWLSDEEIIQMVDAAFRAAADPTKVILDGTPRTLAQAEWLFDQAQTGRFTIEAVLNLEVQLDIAKRRLANRARVDDTEEAIAARFDQHQREVEPILTFFRSRVPVYDIDGSDIPQEVHKQILACLHKSQEGKR